MIDLSVAEAQQRGWQRVGVLGLGEPQVYFGPLERAGIAYETLEAAARQLLDAAIFDLMAGQQDAESGRIARQALADLRARGADGIILGCTEIPLLLGEAAKAADLIDPAELLAQAAVRYALEN